MAPHYFTPEEANEALAEVRPLAERLVERRRALVRALARQERLTAQIAGNGANLTPADVAEAQAAVEEEAAAVAEAIEAIHALGVLVKDLDTGLVDFPALRDGEEVLLCWRVGEEEIGYWHGVDEGFAGRKSLLLF
jgi:hypothetical protein